MEDNRKCEYCGGDIAIRNPTGHCDHLYYPDYVNKDLAAINEVSKNQTEAANAYLLRKGYGKCEACSPAPFKSIKVLSMANPRCVACGELVVPLVMDFAATKSDLGCAKNYLKTSGLTTTPDRVREVLNLSCSSSTLSRKFRAASTGDNPELLRSYYTNSKGRTTAQYRYNPNYKENNI